MQWIGVAYFNERDKQARPSESAKEIFNLKDVYIYLTDSTNNKLAPKNN